MAKKRSPEVQKRIDTIMNFFVENENQEFTGAEINNLVFENRVKLNVLIITLSKMGHKLSWEKKKGRNKPGRSYYYVYKK